ncbi:MULTISPECIES: hypothetical protein [unclassified Streptomyces]|uniref:hypothetical protein n=1 Tax=unclassified Streptomyces TaxID=2593676 RepID=UPI002E8235F3|nr:hypothetical protein [Streptomyces sp. NBC_00589]WTI33604.1 hypothetical protein OIC96_00505 [Streptomyces sp. NBC_00775]WUB32724.1 hypothetical protein OHA51_49230 [Streptomyces sp. NBC_00589]
MQWTTSITCGALGGLVVEIVVFYGRIATWQAARHRALSKDKTRDQLPPLGKYIDAPSDALAAFTRLSLGAGAGWIFSPQLTGVFAAVAVGASAPALLRQLGSAKTIQAAISGNNSAAPVIEPAQHSTLSPDEAEVRP